MIHASVYKRGNKENRHEKHVDEAFERQFDNPLLKVSLSTGRVIVDNTQSLFKDDNYITY